MQQNGPQIAPAYAGFWIRLVATLLDTLVLLIVLGIPLGLIYGNEYWLDGPFIRGFWDVIFSYVIPFVGTLWFWRRFLGTPGKLLTGIKIVDAVSGDRMSRGQAVGRYFAYIVSILPLFLGFLWVGIDKRKQAWHDKLAGTIVVHNNKNHPAHIAPGAE